MSSTDRIADALERIATAQEAMVSADPLAMLDAVMQEQGMPGEAQEPMASNGVTTIYRCSDPEWQVVLRKDKTAESGYAVNMERA